MPLINEGMPSGVTTRLGRRRVRAKTPSSPTQKQKCRAVTFVEDIDEEDSSLSGIPDERTFIPSISGSSGTSDISNESSLPSITGPGSSVRENNTSTSSYESEIPSVSTTNSEETQLPFPSSDSSNQGSVRAANKVGYFPFSTSFILD